MDETDAFSQGLAYVNSAGHAVMKVDNTTNVAFNQSRNSVSSYGVFVCCLYLPPLQVRITTQQSYAVGSLWIIDAIHLPYGCSVRPCPARHTMLHDCSLLCSLICSQVWPAFWTKGPLWPNDGEIDIIEAINLMPSNQMALHTLPGCTHTTPPNQNGTSGELDCSQPPGCLVAENAPNSFQSGFAAAGGGVWATQFDVAGILCVFPLRSACVWC